MLSRFAALSLSTVLIVAGCAGGSQSVPSDGAALGPITGCNDSIVTGFRPDSLTSVTLVRLFRRGEPLALGGEASLPKGGPASPLPSPPPIAARDVCMVKMVVGPGHPGPADAPSTSVGIGIEVWLPMPQDWNKRVHLLGGGGCSREAANVIRLDIAAGTRASTVGQSPAGIATGEGAVSGMTDLGHVVNDCAFAMNPDGSVNTFGWKDFSYRAIRELILKTKALARAFYGVEPSYTYWDGFSTGGRQALKIAQEFPEEVDGTLAGAPAINWNRFSIAGAYAQLLYQHELGGAPLTEKQRRLMNHAAINACDTVGGVRLGYILDISTCTYDPTKDPNVICVADGGANTTASCVSKEQAAVQNRIWYGQTADGSAPEPALDNGWSSRLDSNHRWWGVTRGAADGNAGVEPFGVMTDYLALVLEDARVAGPSFVNSTGRGESGYRNLTYVELANAVDRGEAMQAQFADINTNNPDLARLRASGTRVLHYHGIADGLVPPQGSIDFYNRAADRMGGFEAMQDYYRLYLIPAMGHALSNGTFNRSASPPMPTHAQLYEALTAWVERGVAPGRIDIHAAATREARGMSQPICPYPQRAVYQSGSPYVASSYICG